MKLRHKTFQNNTIEIRMTNSWETVAEQQKKRMMYIVFLHPSSLYLLYLYFIIVDHLCSLSPFRELLNI